jgi:hypothetical protein
MLFPYQRLALDAFAGAPGSRALRNLLVFHSMGSGKTPVVHAVLNLVVGVALGAVPKAPASSLTCRVALLWQSTKDAERQRAFLRRNHSGIFAGVDGASPDVHPAIFFGSIDNKSDVDALKDQLQLPTEGWLARLRATQKAADAGSKELAALQMKARDSSRAEHKQQHELSRLDGGSAWDDPVAGPSERQVQAKLGAIKRDKLELAKKLEAAQKVHAVRLAERKARRASWQCTPRNRLLFVVDECHKLFAEGNRAYGLIRCCVTCDHATVLLMSGTPVTSAEPVREFVRLCMLLGGRRWTLAALRLAGTDDKAAARGGAGPTKGLYDAVAATCTYAALAAVLRTGVPADDITNARYAEMLRASSATLDAVDLALKAAEEHIVGFLAKNAQRAAPLVALDHEGARLLHISYYGRVNGNVAMHELERPDFTQYDFASVLTRLRASKLAAVPGATQISGGEGDPNFELIDGAYYSRTIDPAAYTVDAQGRAHRRDAPLRPGALRHAGPWHSTREFAPTFMPNRVVRCLHVCVPSYVANTYRDGGKLVPSDKAPAERGGLVHDHVVAWMLEHMATTPEWRGATNEARVFQLKGKHWPWYHFVWALAVAYAIACACTFDAPKQTNLVVYVDRDTYGLSSQQMELLIHAVFDGSLRHPFQQAAGHAGAPYAGPATRSDGTLSYQIGWATTIDVGARPMGAWFAPSAPALAQEAEDAPYTPMLAAAAAFGKPLAPADLVREFGDLFALDVASAFNAVQGRTTLWDEELQLDVAQTKGSRSHLALHVLFKDLFVDEAGGKSLNTEGDDLGPFGAVLVLEVPDEMTAQKMEQLFDRVNRVVPGQKKENKRLKFVACVTRPSVFLDADAPLQRMGSTPRDRTVAALIAELVRHAADCDKHRAPSERAFRCAA